jgi:hypothetical protein
LIALVQHQHASREGRPERDIGTDVVDPKIGYTEQVVHLGIVAQGNSYGTK